MFLPLQREHSELSITNEILYSFENQICCSICTRKLHVVGFVTSTMKWQRRTCQTCILELYCKRAYKPLQYRTVISVLPPNPILIDYFVCYISY